MVDAGADFANLVAESKIGVDFNSKVADGIGAGHVKTVAAS